MTKRQLIKYALSWIPGWIANHAATLILGCGIVAVLLPLLPRLILAFVAIDVYLLHRQHRQHRDL